MAYTDGNIVIGTSVDVGGLNTGLAKIEKSLKRLNGLALGFIGLKIFSTFSKSAIDAASDLAEVQNIVDTVFEDMSWKAERFANLAIEKFGMSELAAKQTAGSFAAMGKAMGLSLDDATDMAIMLAKQSGDFASFFNLSQDYARVALSAVYTGETETMKRYGIILTEANLQQYALTKGIDKKVKSMSAEEKLMLRYNYIQEIMNKESEIGVGIAGDFEKTSHQWANQQRLLTEHWKQFLIVLGNGLTTVGAPVLRWLNDVVVRLTAWAKMTGYVLKQLLMITDTGQNISDVGGGFSDIAAGADEAADATTKATKAAKKYLSPIDEINRYSSDNKSDEGTDITSALKFNFDDLWESELPYKFEIPWGDLPDTWEGLGEWFRDGAINALKNIDWETIKANAAAAGKHLAELLNGLLKPNIDGETLFGELGRTIAEALNTALAFLYNFGVTFDWAQFGRSIADGINNFFSTFDFKQFADTIDAWVQGLFTTLKEAITHIDWKLVFSSIKEFFENLDPETVAIIFGFIILKSLIKQALLANLIAGIKEGLGITGLGESAKALGVSLGENLIQGWNATVAELAAGTSLHEALMAGFGPVATIFSGLVLTIGGVILAVKEFFDMWSGGWDLLSTILEALGIAIATIGIIILAPIEGIGVLIAAAVAAGVFLASQLGIWLHDNWDTVSQWISDVWNKITEFFSGIWNKLVEIFGPVVGWIYDTIIKPIIDYFVGYYTRFGQFIKGCWILVEAVWKVASEWFNKWVIQPIEALFKWVWEKVSGFFSRLWSDIKLVWTVVSDWFKRNVAEPVKKVWEDVTEKIGKFFSDLWDGIKEGVCSAFNTVISTVESAINGVIKLINGLIKGFNKVVEWGAEITGEDWSGIDLIKEVHIPRLAKGAVIPPNKEFMAVLGDQKRGTNIEAPLDTIKLALAEVLSELGGTGGGTQTINLTLDGMTLAEAVVKNGRVMQTINGRNPFSF